MMGNNKEIVISKEAISELVDNWCKSGEVVRILIMDVYEGIELANNLTRCLNHSIEVIQKEEAKSDMFKAFVYVEHICLLIRMTKKVLEALIKSEDEQNSILVFCLDAQEAEQYHEVFE